MDPLVVISALGTAIIAALTAVGRAFIRGDLVAGTLYRSMEQRAIAAETSERKTLETLRETVSVVKASRELTGTPDAPK